MSTFLTGSFSLSELNQFLVGMGIRDIPLQRERATRRFSRQELNPIFAGGLQGFLDMPTPQAPAAALRRPGKRLC